MKNIKIFSSIAEYENAKSRGVLNVPNISFINESDVIKYLPKLEDPYNGYEYVDLGLPSGLKWATCNVGANSPERAGLYFAWGETTGFTAEQVTSGVRAFDSASYTASGISTNLTLAQDAAYVNLGGTWRMPTKDEYQELLDNCNAVWTDDYNGTGVAGRVFTSKVNGNSVFFPAAGLCTGSSMNGVGSLCYDWSASWDSEFYAWFLLFYSGTQDMHYGSRFFGFSVRGVCE